MKRKILMVAATLATIVPLDILTKRWALEALAARPRSLLGVPLTLAFNKGAAFSLSVGAASRYVFLAFSVIALAALLRLLQEAAARDTTRHLAAALVIAGAVGNMIDRVRWERGVVDFIGPVNLGFTYFPIFNVADSAITIGISLLAISFLRESLGARAAARVGSSA